MNTPACKVCKNEEGNTVHAVKEMQLGMRESFNYLECGRCGCMQLMQIPDDLSKYYPNEGYYSFNLGLNFKEKPGLLRRIKGAYLIYGKHKIAGSLLSIGYSAPAYYSWMKHSGVQYHDAILDVGTGNGSLLLDLHRIGYTNLAGIDPFINEDRQYGKISIQRKSLFACTGKYDLVMMHHAFEHMDEPLAVLQQAYRLLNPGKCLLIRTPVMGMYSWKKYGVNWMDLDAPRHIIIHSLKSMRLLAEAAGFELRKTIFDGNYMSLIGTEQYAKDIALNEPASYMVNRQASSFSKQDIEAFRSLNAKNNAAGQADQAAFYLFRP